MGRLARRALSSGAAGGGRSSATGGGAGKAGGGASGARGVIWHSGGGAGKSSSIGGGGGGGGGGKSRDNTEGVQMKSHTATAKVKEMWHHRADAHREAGKTGGRDFGGCGYADYIIR